MKFIAMVWAAFLARQSPVSTMANPACMNMTRKPVISVQTKLMAILSWPTWFTRSLIVTPFWPSLTAMSLAVPVSAPSGSPLALASALGTGAAATSASVIGFGVGAAAAGAAGVVAGVCAKPSGAKQSTATHNESLRFIEILILASPFLPDCILEIGPIEHANNPEKTHRQPEEHNPQARGV